MEQIDRYWIQNRLDGTRGEKAALASAIGISTDKLSKILKGERNIQAREIPKLLAFFQEGYESAPAVGGVGMSEGAIPYTPNTGDVAATLLAQSAPGGPVLHLFEVTRPAPALSILAGDLLGVEITDSADAGDMVLATAANTETGEAQTVVARFFPPWFIDGQIDIEGFRSGKHDVDVAIMGRIWSVLRRPGRG